LPATRYAKTADGAHIAYQVWGDGPLDLVWVPGFISHLDLQWENPGWAGLADRLGRFSRVIAFDKRGTGLSDRTESVPDLDQRMLDLLAVLDAADCERVVMLGMSEGGALAVLFSTSHPDRVTSLALYGSYANPLAGPDHAAGRTPEEYAEFTESLLEGWGEGAGLEVFAPSVADLPISREMWAKWQRLSASPGAARQLMGSYNLIDVRPALSLVQVPTLVLHRTDDRVVQVELGRELAEGIPNARFVELPGADHLPTIDFEDIADNLEEFFTGVVSAGDTERCLATVLFTDIVSSTEQLREAGDARWKELLDEHDRLVARQVTRFGGRVVKGTGDGVVAVFDGPTRAIKAAQAMAAGAGALGINIRAGLHTGEIIERDGGDVAGIAVHIAARVAGEAGADEVLVSRTTTDLVAGSNISFEDRGEYTLKGLDGSRQLFAVTA
jgi:class 3 adenylate cyclase